MNQAGGVCTSRDAQASGISRVDLHGTPRFAIRQWTGGQVSQILSTVGNSV